MADRRGGTRPGECPASAHKPPDSSMGRSVAQAGLVGIPPDCFPAPPAPVASGKQWTVTYSEEFNGTALDLAKLTPCFDWNFGGCTSSFNTGKERYLPSQVQVSNGTAKLVAEPLAAPVREQCLLPGSMHVQGGTGVNRTTTSGQRFTVSVPVYLRLCRVAHEVSRHARILHCVLDAADESELQLQHRNRHCRDPRRPPGHDLHDLSLQRSNYVLYAQQRLAQQRGLPDQRLFNRLRAGSAWIGSRPISRGTSMA